MIVGWYRQAAVLDLKIWLQMAFKSLNPQLLSYSQAINEKKELVFQLMFWKKAKTTKTFSFLFLNSIEDGRFSHRW